MRKIEVVARNAQQALEKASKKLGAILEDLTVLEEYEPDELDLATLAKEEAEEGAVIGEGEPSLFVIEQSADELLDRAEEWLQGLVQRFQPGSTVEVVAEEDDRLRAIIEAPDPSIFIGKQGQTLDALQHIASRIIQTKIEGLPVITLEVGQYREKREAQLRRLAENAATKAQRTRRSVALPPMTSQDRKLIHNILKAMPGISTISEGHEPNRYIVVEVEGASNRASTPGGRRAGGRGGRDAGGFDKPAREPMDDDADDSKAEEAPAMQEATPAAAPSGRQGKGAAKSAGKGAGRGGKAGAKSATTPTAKPKKSPLMTTPSESSEEFREEHIEEGRSRLPVWQEPGEDTAQDAERPLVDELE